MQGLEFVVSYDPLQAAAQTDTSFAHEPSNIWVIRKQNRRKRSGFEDEVSVISTFFVVGDAIYMAPSVASVVGNRIVCSVLSLNPPPTTRSEWHANISVFFSYLQLSAVTSLSRFMKTASTLPTFTPSYGHTYMPPGARSKEPNQQSSQQSKESTPMPDAPSDTQSISKTNLGVSATTPNYQDTRSLAESFNLLTRYGDEFMDENPLAGEPGSFILSRTGGEGGGAGKQAAPKTGAGPSSLSVPASGPPGRATTPQVRVETPKGSDKGASPPSSGGDRGKRKKSRNVV
jgi:mediator of RNA polymerase II transcription subunit 6